MLLRRSGHRPRNSGLSIFFVLSRPQIAQIAAIAMPFSRFWMRVCGAVLLALVLCAALETAVELEESNADLGPAPSAVSCRHKTHKAKDPKTMKTGAFCADKTTGLTAASLSKCTTWSSGGGGFYESTKLCGDAPSASGTVDASGWHRPFPPSWVAHFPTKTQVR